LGDQIEKNEVDKACITYGGEERYIHGFGGETWGKETLGRPRRRRDDNIKMDLQEVRCGAWTDSISGYEQVAGTCGCVNEPLGSTIFVEFLY
jgi:hypothetical protein